MTNIVTRTLEWSLPEEPLVRYSRPAKGSQSTIMDALDLAFTLRGQGWEWSRGVYIPRETRPTDRRGFTLYVVSSVVIHAFICVLLHNVIRSFSPTGIGANGGSIYDDTLPFHTRHLRATVISIIATFAIYAFIQTYYDVCTLVGILVLGHDPEQWPPAFDAPWRATSISDFWGRRWHQFCRRMFLVQGGYPLGYFFGKPGLVIGAFLSSAMIHHVGFAMLHGNSDNLGDWRLLVGFGMMAPIILAERAFRRLTGHRVCGFAGWVWSMTWFAVLGNLIIDGFARCGQFGFFKFTESILPRRDGVERLVAHFDSWLHTV